MTTVCFNLLKEIFVTVNGDTLSNATNMMRIFHFFSGDFKFDKIGSPYNSSVPVFAMRSVPALAGSMLIPLVYMIMLQLNYSQWTAALGAFLFLFGMIKLL